MKRTFSPAVTIAIAALLAASASFAHASGDVSAISVPAGHAEVMSALGAGDLTYECRVKANMPGMHEWVFAGPNAVLYDKNKTPVGKYYGGPTWEANDGSKVTGKQLAVAPSGNPASIPLQLVQASPSTGTGAMVGITYIQRINTKGGVAPGDACTADTVGVKKLVKYEADYVFYKAS
ncbi:hypothetical protein ACFDR9_005580 [Janthinobacterium sp. CG_23.3]|uniref:DUF3455 domain-containing protein n=1 Tax=Janthinobacterium sp. CG_23.3 TaxID=3349634 RepID=UPI0038D3E64D